MFYVWVIVGKVSGIFLCYSYVVLYLGYVSWFYCFEIIELEFYEILGGMSIVGSVVCIWM